MNKILVFCLFIGLSTTVFADDNDNEGGSDGGVHATVKIVQKVKEIVKSMVWCLKTVIPTLLGIVEQILDKLLEAAKDGADSLLTGLAKALKDSKLVKLLENFLFSLNKNLKKVMKGVPPALGEAVQLLANILITLGEDLGASLTDVIDALTTSADCDNDDEDGSGGVDATGKVIQKVRAIVRILVGSLQNVATKLLTIVEQILGKLLAAALDGAESLVTGLAQALQDLKLGQLFDTLVSSVNKNVAKVSKGLPPALGQAVQLFGKIITTLGEELGDTLTRLVGILLK